MNDSKALAPMLSPADTNSVFGFCWRYFSTAPASTPAPATPPVSWSRRPWKSLIVRICRSGVFGCVGRTSNTVVVPETSLPVTSSGTPVGERRADTKAMPSGPRSPAAAVLTSAAALRLLT